MTAAPTLFDQIPGPDPSTLARTGDPITSQQAAAIYTIHRGSQRHRLLNAYRTAWAARGAGLTDEEAGTRTGIPRVADTRRCSELRRAELIAPTGDTRPTTTGSPAMVCAITNAGRAALEAST